MTPMRSPLPLGPLEGLRYPNVAITSLDKRFRAKIGNAVTAKVGVSPKSHWPWESCWRVQI